MSSFFVHYQHVTNVSKGLYQYIHVILLTENNQMPTVTQPFWQR